MAAIGLAPLPRFASVARAASPALGTSPQRIPWQPSQPTRCIVFLSSTAADLSEHRRAIIEALAEVDHFECKAMEYFGARPGSPAEHCEALILGCTVFVVIVGHLYGSYLDNNSDNPSYTEFEYDTAFKNKKPCLVFVAPDDFLLPATLREPDEKWNRQRKFREKVVDRRLRANFQSPGNLAVRVLAALANFREEQRQAFRETLRGSPEEWRAPREAPASGFRGTSFGSESSFVSQRAVPPAAILLKHEARLRATGHSP